MLPVTLSDLLRRMERRNNQTTDAQGRRVELACPLWAHHPHRPPTYSRTETLRITKDAPVTQEVTRVLGTAHHGLGAETKYVFPICHRNQNKLFLRTNKMFWKKKKKNMQPTSFDWMSLIGKWQDKNHTSSLHCLVDCKHLSLIPRFAIYITCSLKQVI